MAMPMGTVFTLAGNPDAGFADGPADGGALFNQPQGLAVAADGTIYIADTDNGAIRKLDTQGQVTTLVQNVAQFFYPAGLAIGQDGGVLYISDVGINAIWQLDLGTQQLQLLAAASDAGISAQLYEPLALAYDPSGHALWVAQVGGPLQRIDLDSQTISALPDSGETQDGVAIASGSPEVFFTATDGNGVMLFEVSDGGAVFVADRDFESLAVDSHGNVLGTSGDSNGLLEWTTAGCAVTLLSSPTPGYLDGMFDQAEFNFDDSTTRIENPGLAFSHQGDLLVTQPISNVIRVVKVTNL